MSFGKRLRSLREDKKLTQAELAAILGLGESTISFYEADKRKPDHDILVSIADYFDVSLDYLLGRKDKSAAENRYIFRTFMQKTIHLLRKQYGCAMPDFLPFMLIQLGVLYANSKGISLPPESLPDIKIDLTKEQIDGLATELDKIFSPEANVSDFAVTLANEIENLSPREQMAMKTMLEVLKSRDEQAADVANLER